MKKNNFKLTFGSFIREQRIKLEVGQRELAGKIGIAASYLNDIEKNKRKAPKQIIIKKISKVLKINLEEGMIISFFLNIAPILIFSGRFEFLSSLSISSEESIISASITS